MSSVYPVPVMQAIELARKHGVGLVEVVIDQLWGDPDAVRAAGARLDAATREANQYILGYMTDKSTGLRAGIDNYRWSGGASEEYKKWLEIIAGEDGYMTRIRDAIWQIGNNLNQIADEIYEIRGDLEVMCLTLLAAVAAAVAAAGGVPKAAEVTVGLIGAFIVELVKYRNQAAGKFRPYTTALRTLQMQSRDLIRKKSGTMGADVSLPMEIYDYFPAAPPVEIIGGWRNWGTARSESEGD